MTQALANKNGVLEVEDKKRNFTLQKHLFLEIFITELEN